MDKQDLYAIDETVFKKIQEDRKKKEAENKTYFDGMEKGVELMMKAVRDYLNKEAENIGAQE